MPNLPIIFTKRTEGQIKVEIFIEWKFSNSGNATLEIVKIPRAGGGFDKNCAGWD